MARRSTLGARLRVVAALVVASTIAVAAQSVVAADARLAPAAFATNQGVTSGSLDGATRVDPPQWRVLMVGDSTLAAVRNVTASQSLFVGFEPVVDAQGCRRLVWPSCWSNTDFRVPNTVEEAILGTPGVVDVVVVMSGYNDWHDPFGSFVDQIMDAARSKGAQRVVWLTLSTGWLPHTSAEAMGAYAENTRALWRAAPRNPDLVVADWRTYNTRTVGWLEPDGVHLRTRGAWGLADYISRWIAHLQGRPCHAPLDPGGPLAATCPNPNGMTRVPDTVGLYGV